MKKVRLSKRYLDVYGVEIHLLWPCTEAQELAYCKRYGNTPNEVCEENSYASHRPITFTGSTHADIHIIRLSEWDNSPECTAALSHECLHATFHILSSRGVKYSQDSEEAFTYLQQALLKYCLQSLKARKFKVLSL